MQEPGLLIQFDPQSSVWIFKRYKNNKAAMKALACSKWKKKLLKLNEIPSTCLERRHGMTIDCVNVISLLMQVCRLVFIHLYISAKNLLDKKKMVKRKSNLLSPGFPTEHHLGSTQSSNAKRDFIINLRFFVHPFNLETYWQGFLGDRTQFSLFYRAPKVDTSQSMKSIWQSPNFMSKY